MYACVSIELHLCYKNVMTPTDYIKKKTIRTMCEIVADRKFLRFL